MNNYENNPFKQLSAINAPSPQLKERVMASSSFALFLISTLDLFSVKAINTVIDMLQTNK